MKNSDFIDVTLIAEKGNNSLFHKVYNLSNSLVPEKKVVFGTKVEQKCRFCDKNSSLTSFKKIAHIMPEFMGNKYAFSNFECDSCNEYFGKLEDSLSNFAGILNSFSVVKGKKGYSKFKGDKEELEIFATNKDNLTARSSKSDKSETFFYDKEKKRIFVDVNQPGYIPMDVYKALVKIGICMLDESKLSDYKKAIDWLQEPNKNNYELDFLFTVFRKIGGQTRFVEPVALLFEKNYSNHFNKIPHHTLIIFYGIIQYQIFLPFSLKDINLSTEKNIIFPLEENLIIDRFENGVQTGIEIDHVRLVGTEKITGERNKFSIGFTEI